VKGAVYLYGGDDYLTNGSFEDLRRLGISPREGMRLTFYDIDADELNRPTYLCREGILHFEERTSTWFVQIDEETYRSVPKLETDDQI